MVPSLGGRGGSMVSRCLPAQGAGRRSAAGGGTRTLTSGQAQRIFIPPTAFAARTRHFGAHASGLWSGLSLHRLPENPGLRCCPSSLYTFPAGTFRPGLARDCHVTGFPEFGQFCIAGFQASTQVSLSPLRLPVPPRPHGWLRISVYHKAAARAGQFGFKVSAAFSSLLTWAS